MSLADDILAKCFNEKTAGKKNNDGLLPGEVTRVKRGKVMFPQFRVRDSVDKGPTPQMGLHLARAPGISRRQHGWRLFCHVEGKTRYIGDGYKTWLRARVAQKLYNYWLSKGYDHHQIPVTLPKEFCNYGRCCNYEQLMEMKKC